MTNDTDNPSSEGMAAFLKKHEAQLRALEDGAISLQEEATERDVAKMRSAARLLNHNSSTADCRAVSEIAAGLEILLGKLPGGAADRSMDALLQGVDALRLLKEELSAPTGLQAEAEVFALNFEAAAAAIPGSGTGLRGTEMAA